MNRRSFQSFRFRVMLAIALCNTVALSMVSGQELWTVISGDTVSRPVAFSSDDALLATVGGKSPEHWLSIWDLATGKELARLPTADQVLFATFAIRGDSLIIYDHTIGGIVDWSFRTGETRSQRNANALARHRPLSVAFSRDRKWVASSIVTTWPKSVVRLQAVADARQIAEFKLGGVPRWLSFSLDGQSLLATEEQFVDRHNRFELHVAQWVLGDDDQPNRSGPFPVTGSRNRGVTRLLGRYCVSTDHRILATSLPRNGLLLIDMETGRQQTIGPHRTSATLEQFGLLGHFGGTPGTVLTAHVFTPDQYQLATSAVGSSEVYLWPITPHANSARIQQPDVDDVRGILFSDSGDLLAVTGTKDRQTKVLVWQFTDPQK